MKNKTTAKQLHLGIAIMVIILAACGHTQKSGTGGLTGKTRLIDKFDIAKQYPNEWYITATGTGDTPEAAKQKAIAGVSQVIKVDINSQQQLNERYIETGTSDDMKLQIRNTINNQIKLVSEQTLKNVNIAKTWFDKKDGLYYAFAYIDRAATSDIYLKDLQKLDDDISVYYEGMKGAKDKLTALAYISRALELAVQRDIKTEQLNTISQGGKSFTPMVSSAELVAARHELTKTMGMKLELQYEKWDEFADAVRDVLGAFGFPVVETDPAIIVKGSMTMEKLERKGYFVRWHVELHLIDTASNAEFLSYSDGSREGHSSYGEAERRAAARLGRTIRKNLYIKLNDYFNSLLKAK